MESHVALFGLFFVNFVCFEWSRRRGWMNDPDRMQLVENKTSQFNANLLTYLNYI
jgi:hypothetical protein